MKVRPLIHALHLAVTLIAALPLAGQAGPADAPDLPMRTEVIDALSGSPMVRAAGFTTIHMRSSEATRIVSSCRRIAPSSGDFTMRHTSLLLGLAATATLTTASLAEQLDITKNEAYISVWRLKHDGKVAKVYRGVDPGVHAEEVLAHAKALARG